MQQLIQKYKAYAIPLVIAIPLLIYFFTSTYSANNELPFEAIPSQISQTIPTEETNPLPNTIFVDVKGAVKMPGVYKLQQGDRLIDAINEAGGYLAEANANVLNHALKVTDEMVIYVPLIGENIEDFKLFQDIQSNPTATSVDSSSNKINLNTATEAELTTLPGIGPSKAQAIIDYRETVGRFKVIEDLKNVSGIGDKTYEKLKDQIDV